MDIGGIIVSDGYTVIANNWASLLAANTQPVAASPNATATIALARGSLNWAGYPANVSSAPAGRAWPNAAYAFVGGNHIPVVVGDASTRPWLASDALVKAANCVVAPNDALRADRNRSISYGPSHSVVDINTTQVVSEGAYTRIPTRYIEATTGLGVLSGLSYPIDALDYNLTTNISTTITQNLISGYTGPTPLVATIVSGPGTGNGTASITSGVLSYTSPATAGTYTITYRLTDSEGTFINGTIRVLVGGVTLTLAAPANVSEGNTGTQTIRFVVTKNGTTASSCSATWTLTGTISASDLQSGTTFTGTVTFAAGDTSKNIDFTLLGDTTAESNETMTVTLSAPSGCTLGTPYTGTTTINNDDTAAIGGRFYQPPHRPTSASQITLWDVTTGDCPVGDWSTYLLIVTPTTANHSKVRAVDIKYKGVFWIGGLQYLEADTDNTPAPPHPHTKTTNGNALPGSESNNAAIIFDRTGCPEGTATGDPLDGRPFIWIDGVDFTSCWASGDAMGTQMSCWWGDLHSFGTRTRTNPDNDFTRQRFNQQCDVYLLRHRYVGMYFFGDGESHSDVMQNNDAQIRSLNAWKCDHKHFGQGFFAGAGTYQCHPEGWWEISDCSFRLPPKSTVVYPNSSVPTWTPIQCSDNAVNPSLADETTTQGQTGHQTQVLSPAGRYPAILLGPKLYFQCPAAAPSTIGTNCIGVAELGQYTGGKRTFNWTTRNLTMGVDKRALDAGIHPYQYLGFTGAGGPFNRALGFYTRTVKMDLPATATLTDAEVGLTRQVRTKADLLTYLDGTT